jgi:hypothetical protein
MPELPASESSRITALLQKRFPRSAYPGLITVGLATGFKNDEPDSERVLSVCFYVKEKIYDLESIPEEQRLPEFVSVGIYDELGNLKYHNLRTDVVTLASARATGRFLSCWESPVVRARCSAGVTVSWLESGSTKQGLMTVGHAFFDGTEYWNPGEPTALTRLVSLYEDQTRSIGELKTKIPTSNSTSYVADLAIVQLNSPLSKVLPNGSKLVSISQDEIASFGELVFNTLSPDAPTSSGYLLVSDPTPTRIPFQVNGYLNKLALYLDDTENKLLLLKHLVRVQSEELRAFGPGRSGSPWVVQLSTGGKLTEKLFAIQVGGIDPDYTTGFGLLCSELPTEQYFSKALAQLSAQIGAQVEIDGYF